MHRECDLDVFYFYMQNDSEWLENAVVTTSTDIQKLTIGIERLMTPAVDLVQ